MPMVILPAICGIHCQCSASLYSNSGNVAAGSGYDHVSTGLEYPGWPIRDGLGPGRPVKGV